MFYILFISIFGVFFYIELIVIKKYLQLIQFQLNLCNESVFQNTIHTTEFYPVRKEKSVDTAVQPGALYLVDQ